MKAQDSLPVMEHFYTLQGEGLHQGKAAYFIRLAGCDVGCVWCDVKESWDRSRHPEIPIDTLINEVKKTPARIVVITGGEPFLYLDLQNLVASIPQHINVKIWSGLGVDEKRFAREVERLPTNVSVVVSAENIGPAYEFSRYGNTWSRFVNNLDQLTQQGIGYEFNATVTNLTVLGLKDFIDWADGTPINFQPCTDPDYLSIGVLDPQTKNLVQTNLEYLPDFISGALMVEPTEKQVYNLKVYIKEFTQRRSLNMDIFPTSLVSWLQQ